MEIRNAVVLPVRQERSTVEERIRASSVLVDQVGPPQANGPLPERVAAQRNASLEARDKVRAQAATWGYLGDLMADGGKARVDALHNGLNAYLKTTPLWPTEGQRKV